ncbi:MAG: PaaI family thioesterase [Nitrospirae bacterium]|nr:PaaI family thioesterase [Nitrospirota bacterium]
MELIDDGYCFACGPGNPAGLKLNFVFDGRTMRAEFVPRREHQGFLNIVHGGIISTLLDEAMGKLSIETGTPAVTARLDVRLRKVLRPGQKIVVEAEIVKGSRKLMEAYAKIVTEEGEIIADAFGKLMKIQDPGSGVQGPG